MSISDFAIDLGINIPTGKLEDLYFIEDVNLFSTQHEEVFFWYEFLYNTFPNLGDEG